jgi:hypothetical protein
MKKMFFVLVIILSQTISGFTQDEPVNQAPGTDDSEIKTLFKKPDHAIKVGYYLGPEFVYTQFDFRNVFMGGLSMGVIIDHFFSVGLAGYGILNSRNLWYDNVDTIISQGAYLYGGYGGVKFEFRILPASPVHLNFPVLIGGGGLVYNTRRYSHHDYDNYDGYTLDWDSFFVFEPGVMVELNLIKFLRLDAGITYRYTPDLDLMNSGSGMINNFNANLSLKFGKF